MKTLLPLAMLAGLAACSSLGFEAAVDNRTPFTPPDVFAAWWQATEDCSGLSGDMGRVSWYLATAITGDGKIAAGRWSEPHDIILVRGYEGEERIVRHEMLHDLLAGDPQHTSSVWAACDLIID